MRKFLTALLVLPFLAGANVATALPTGIVASAASADETVSTSAAPIAQPPLPGHITISGLATALPLPDSSVDGWRTSSGSGRSGSVATAAVHTALMRVHLHLIRREQLEFSRAVARARANEPVTFSTPPPTSSS